MAVAFIFSFSGEPSFSFLFFLSSSSLFPDDSLPAPAPESSFDPPSSSRITRPSDSFAARLNVEGSSEPPETFSSEPLLLLSLSFVGVFVVKSKDELDELPFDSNLWWVPTTLLHTSLLSGFCKKPSAPIDSALFSSNTSPVASK